VQFQCNYTRENRLSEPLKPYDRHQLTSSITLYKPYKIRLEFDKNQVTIKPDCMPTRKTKPLTRKRIFKEPEFERTRENMSEFGRACKANQLIRIAFREVLFNMTDRYVSGRLTKRMMSVISNDPVNGRGKRKITGHALPLLEGFNFNGITSLQQSLIVPYNIVADRSTGQLTIHTHSCRQSSMAITGSNATRFRIIAGIASIDFDKNDFECTKQESDLFDLHRVDPETVHFSFSLPGGKPDPWIVILGIEFCHQIGDKLVMADRRYNAVAVVKVI
jgi:hypothetical protein